MASGEIAGFFGTNGAIPAPGDNTFTSTAWFRADLRGGRLYYITCTPLQVNNANSFGNEELTTRWVVTDGTGSPDAEVYAQTTQTISNSPGKDALHQGLLYAFGPDIDETRTTTFALQSSGTSDDLTYTNVGGFNVYALDVGPLTALNNGGTGAPGGTLQYVQRYFATDTQTYDGSSNPLGGDGEVWRGDFGDGNGNTRSIVCFDGAQIRSDLTGATVQSATLYMHCIEASESQGTLAFEGSTATTPPGTLGAGSVEYSYSDDFPPGQLVGVDILGQFLDDIIGGDNSMHIVSTVLGLAETKFAGYADVAKRPYIEIKYSK